jgi:hypothetical protein
MFKNGNQEEKKEKYEKLTNKARYWYDHNWTKYGGWLGKKTFAFIALLGAIIGFTVSKAVGFSIAFIAGVYTAKREGNKKGYIDGYIDSYELRDSDIEDAYMIGLLEVKNKGVEDIEWKGVKSRVDNIKEKKESDESLKKIEKELLDTFLEEKDKASSKQS